MLIPCVFSFFELSPTEMDCLVIYVQEDIISVTFLLIVDKLVIDIIIY